MNFYEGTSFEEPLVIDGQVEVIVGVISANGDACNMVEFVQKMEELLGGIPEQYRPHAEIKFRTWEAREDFTYGRLVLSYKRPATDREIELDLEKRQETVRRDRIWLQKKIEQLIEEADLVGMSTEAIGLVQADGGYVIERMNTAE